MAEKLPNLKKETNTQIEEANKIDPNRPTPRHIIIKQGLMELHASPNRIIYML